MDDAALRGLIDDVRTGAVTADEAVHRLRRLPFSDLGFAQVDHHRSVRQGMAEAVYAPHKTPDECAAIVVELRRAAHGPVLLTRADDDQVAASLAAAPEGEVHLGQPHTVVWDPMTSPTDDGAGDPGATRPQVTLVTAGTADGPVAAECEATLSAYDVDITRITDAGVSGIHRLLARQDDLGAADAIVTVAGMEGALASVVAGLTAVPVIAVPTSTGYGAGLEGITALLAMHASCAAGVTVVGIDNGYGAACAAIRILHRSPRPTTSADGATKADGPAAVTRPDGTDRSEAVT